MSQENVEIVRSIYEATNRHDWDAVFRDQHPDAEQILSPPTGPYRGREEIQGYWQDLMSALDEGIAEPERSSRARRPAPTASTTPSTPRPQSTPRLT